MIVYKVAHIHFDRLNRAWQFINRVWIGPHTVRRAIENHEIHGWIHWNDDRESISFWNKARKLE